MRKIAGIVCAVGFSSLLLGQVTNGGFESGMAGWTVSGANKADSVTASNFTPNQVFPVEGTRFLVLATGPFDVGGPIGDVDGNGVREYNITTVSQNVSVSFPEQKLCFYWKFLTNDILSCTGGWEFYDDLFQVRINGWDIIRRSIRKPGGISPFLDTPAYDNRDYRIVGSAVGGNVFDRACAGATDWYQTCVAVPNSGTYNLEFLIADQGDSAVDSALAVDQVELIPYNHVVSLYQVTDSAGVYIEDKGGTLIWRPRETWYADISENGGKIVFGSSGDFGTGNPNGYMQVFVKDSGGINRLTSMTGGGVEGVGISPSGDYVVYSAQDDPLGTNGDGNKEIFLFSYVGVPNTSQLTNSSGCVNSYPVVSNNGVVAFETTCSGIVPGHNSDGNKEILIWDSSNSLYLYRETTNCSSFAPQITADGTRVVFVSNCNYTGGNSDGNNEIFLWDIPSDSIIQITTSSASIMNVSPDISDTGEVVFVSNGDYLPGNNVDGSVEVFKWSGGSFSMVTDRVGEIFLKARIDGAGEYVAAERLDALTGEVEIFYFKLTAPKVTNSIAKGINELLQRVVSVNGIPIVLFISTQDYAGLNPDSNRELFQTDVVVSGEYRKCKTISQTIPDNSATGVSDTIAVPYSASVQRVEVYLRVDHNRLRDLRGYLTHGTTTVTIFDLTGSGCNRDDIDAWIADNGDRPIDNECPNKIPSIESPPSFIPTQPLSSFVGQSSSGNWTITVTDTVNNVTGSLIEWCISIFT